MSRTCITADSPRWWGLLLACFALSCSVPDGLMLNISVPANTPVKSYVIKLQDRETRKVVFLSGLQKNADGRDLSTQPLRVAMPFNQHGKFLLQVLAANVDNVEELPQAGVTEPQLFYAKILDVAVLQELDVPLLPVAPEFDADGDHFPDAVRWLAAVPEAAARYQGTPEVLDCVDGDPPAGDIQPIRTRGFDIHPLAQTQCNTKLRPPHSPTATPLPDFVPLDVSCAGMPRTCADKDNDGDPEGSDCDDNDKNRYHGNPRPRNCCQCSDPTSCATNHAKLKDLTLCTPKRCDTAYDYDCTGLNVDCFIDEDCDGYSPNNPDVRLRDCDDTDARVHPNADKICDPPDGVIKDWACDGRPQVGCVPCDLDGDGYQRAEIIGNQVCPTLNYKASNRPIDCDDNDRGVFPGAVTYKGSATLYSDLDQTSRGFNVLSAMRGLCRNTNAQGKLQNTNCDTVSDSAHSGCPTAACDADGDGFPANTVGCAVAGKPTDCNDNDPTIFPGAPLHCDGKDHDCDGSPDQCSVDRDGDGYAASGDCDDTNPAVHPFANEMCNGRDDDCDGLVDEQNPDPNGSQLIQQGTDGNTNIASCADSTIGECGKKNATGFFSGRCVCTTFAPQSTVDANAHASCPGEDDKASFTARCFGATQPKAQSCDADNERDDDCNGSTDDKTGKNLAAFGATCGLNVTGTRCKAGTVVGCDRSKENPFYTLRVPTYQSKDRYLVCSGQTDPIPEQCNGFDDDCSGSLPTNEIDGDMDGYISCSGCDPTKMANNLVYCNDCADNNRNVYPPIPGDKPKAGAPELCDGIDNTCSSGSTMPTPINDGSGQCGSGGDAGKPDCCSVPMLCVNKMTDFKHCGGCDSVLNVCSATTADACVGGACKCSGTAACSVAGSTICKPGQGCVDCLKSADCKDLYPGVTLKAACSAGNKCVECAGDADCSGNASKKSCDLNTNRCVVCKDDTQCLGANKACLIDAADTTNNTCVQCTAKKFCTTNPGNPACDIGRHTCIPCNAGGTDCTVPTATQCKPDAGNNTSLNSCVQCLGDGDCKTPGLTTCNPATNLCVPCLAGLGCAVGKCLVNPNPANNSCVQCLGSTDCAGMATAKTCDPTVHKCVDCDLDTDCMVAGKPACSVYMPVDPVQNMCVECLADKHCIGVSGKPACYVDPMNVANNRCVPCLQGDGCVMPTPVCKTVANPSNNFCVKCLKDMGCMAPKGECYVDKLDDKNNVCTACLDNTDCTVGANIACKINLTDESQNSCVECIDDTTCTGTTPKCDKTTNKCVACLEADDKPCMGATPRCNATLNMCVACRSADDKPCMGATPRCNETLNKCVSCRAADDKPCMGATPRCNETLDKCVACVGNADCAGTPATPTCIMATGVCGP